MQSPDNAMGKSSYMEEVISELDDLCASILRNRHNETGHWRCVHLLREIGSTRHSYFSEFRPQFCKVLEILLANEHLDHLPLSSFIAAQLKVKYPVITSKLIPSTPSINWQADSSILIDESDDLKPLAGDPLFLGFLENTINTDYEWEIFLRNLRSLVLFYYLSSKSLPSGYLRLASAMAQQCFNNEYIFNDSAEEKKVVERLKAELDQGFSISEVSSKEAPLILLAMYCRILDLSSAGGIKEIPLDTFSRCLRPAIQRMVHEPFKEEGLKKDIATFGKISRQGSIAVKNQYEENPYPRWFNLRKRKATLENFLIKKFPRFVNSFSATDKKRLILVAGSGTGRHPLTLAAANPDAQVFAIDLSKVSLAYGKRMALKLDIKNVKFFQGDILDITQLGKYFHHIDCIGVLHHLDDPSAGWQALNQVLLSGGTLHIAVYSKAARMVITYIRNEIRRLGFRPTPGEMKSFRLSLLTQPRYKSIRPFLQLSRDFYSLSSLRDMLFHAREYQYSLAEINRLIQELNLVFLGFRLRNAVLTGQYRELFPTDPGMTDLEYWTRFERAYTGTGHLLDFWLQKPSG